MQHEKYFSHPLIKPNTIQLRDYQKTVSETASKQNCLVVIPTGLGKTIISVIVTANRFQQYPDSKVMFLSPTRPLCAQIQKVFRNTLNIDSEKIILITGKINPETRKKFYEECKIVVSTPQCIENDLKNDRIELTNFSFVTFDEAHRCVKDYAYTFVAKKYIEQAEHPLILGLTASPGGSYEKINEICKNLFIEAVEIRSEIDEDVKPYVKEIEREWVYVDFPQEFEKIKLLLEECLKDDIFWLRDHHFLDTLRPSRKSLLMMQKRVSSRFSASKNYSLLWGVMKFARAIKIEHAIELLETQEVSSLYEYMLKVAGSKKKTDKNLSNDRKFIEAFELVKDLQSKSFEHPKFTKLRSIVSGLVKEKNDIKIIVFANYRMTVEKIKNMLLENGISAEQFIGQATRERKGLSQEQQIETLKRFRDGEFNVLIATSIGEEGLDVPAVDYAIFYEPVPSEIRTIQRRGRVGRQVIGKTILLITKNTRDEAYYWVAFHKEKRMKGILYDMKNNYRPRHKKSKTLKDWV